MRQGLGEGQCPELASVWAWQYVAAGGRLPAYMDVVRPALPLRQLSSMIFRHTEEGRCSEPEKSSNYH